MQFSASGIAAATILAATLSIASGCAGMGLEDIMGGLPVGADVRGEVDWVDERSREIGISSSWGRRETVRYDSRTRVIYRNQRYEVRDLERGDAVAIDVDEGSRGRRYATTVRVERSVRDSDGRRSDGRLRRFDGRVAWVDLERGQFGVDGERGSRYVVSLSHRSTNATVSRFRRLRRGDRVRFEGEAFAQGRIELGRFI